MSNLFQKVELEAFRAGITPRTKESRTWFRKRLYNMKAINRRALLREDPLERRQVGKARQRGSIGDMYMFFYDAKGKETLPYWDAFPLIVNMGPAKDGFYGLNVHYLPIPLRARFLDGLMERTTNKKFDETTRFRLTYNFLKSSSKLRYFKPCFKHYLTSHVKGQLSYIPPAEWEIAVFLPAAQWKNGKRSQVYRDSRSMI